MTRSIELKGGPMDGAMLELPDGFPTRNADGTDRVIPFFANRNEQMQYEDAGPDEPDVIVQHGYLSKDGRYAGYSLV